MESQEIVPQCSGAEFEKFDLAPNCEADVPIFDLFDGYSGLRQ
jgi:hypothetical protein